MQSGYFASRILQDMDALATYMSHTSSYSLIVITLQGLCYHVCQEAFEVTALLKLSISLQVILSIREALR